VPIDGRAHRRANGIQPGVPCFREQNSAVEEEAVIRKVNHHVVMAHLSEATDRFNDDLSP
jgi:hypothetical protein